MANVQISEELFVHLSRFFLFGDESPQTREKIAQGLKSKLAAMEKRQAYTAYKTAETAEEREQARQDYLNKIGLPTDFRW